MSLSMSSLARRIDSTTAYLTPLLPLASCHTVEFYTQRLWSRLVPHGVRAEVEGKEAAEAVEAFWAAASCEDCAPSDSPLAEFVRAARAHHLAADGEVCVTGDEARRRLTPRAPHGEEADTEQFISPKKGHELRQLLGLAAGLAGSHCVELGGGKGYVGEALARLRGVAALTVDRDQTVLRGGERRAAILQRFLPSQPPGGVRSRHRYANAFVDDNTDLVSLVKDHFPEDFEHNEKCNLLITGLHTCGDLGASSLRVFAREPTASALCNVPCCYHLLTELAQPQPLWGELEGNLTSRPKASGFPMSHYLRGYQLGRNARMLASQSIDRTVVNRTLPTVGLHYRAVLQALLQKYLPDSVIPEGRLKGIAAKSQNFEEYFNRAIKKLNLKIHPTEGLTTVEDQKLKLRECLTHLEELRIQLMESLTHLEEQRIQRTESVEDVEQQRIKLTESLKDADEQRIQLIESLKKMDAQRIQPTQSLSDVEIEYRCSWKSLVMFHLLRLCLAQVVESLILLDRLMFLQERGFKDSFLVKLFEASKSPRCHAIVARRYNV